MKIIRYQKKKQGKYILQLEGGEEFETYEDLILKYNLLIRKEISHDVFQKIKEENKMYEVYFASLNYIKIRIRSVQELIDFLLKKGYKNEQIDSTVALLKSQGYLNDLVYARSFVHDRIMFSFDGPLKIKRELDQLQLSKEQIQDILSEYTEEMELERIEKIILKQMRKNHSKSSYSLKQKIFQYLIDLGYSSSLIEKKLYLVVQDEDLEQELYQKEYRKLYQKLSQKYQGKELEYRIKQKLFQKGFRQNSELC